MKKIMPWPRAIIHVIMIILVTGASNLAAAIDDKVDKGKTVTVITRDDLEKIPIGRNLQDILSLAPGVQNIGGNIRMRGSSQYQNVIMFDGVNAVDPFHRDQMLNISPDAIERIEIVEGGAGAEHSTASGGTINIITKSGGNKFSGSVSSYLTPDFLSTNLDDGLQGDRTRYDTYFETGINLGGPLIKDKLWFFGNFTIRNRNTQPLWEDNNPEKHHDVYPFIKFTYTPDAFNNFGLSYNYSRHAFDVDESWYDKLYTTKHSQPHHNISGSWNRNFQNGWLGSWQTNYTQFNKDHSTEPSTSAGSGSFSSYGVEKKASVFNSRFDITVPPIKCKLTSHDLKFGVGFNTTSYYQNNWDSYGHSSTRQEYGHTIDESMTSYFMNKADLRSDRFSVYLQDNWTISDNFTLNYGVRFEKETTKWNGSEEPIADWSLLSPRISFTYDITGDGKNLVKLSAGRYMSQNHYDWWDHTNPAGTTGWDHHIIKEDGVTTLDDLSEYTYPAQSQGLYDSDYNTPYLDELTLRFEKALSDDIAVSLTGFYKKRSNQTQTVDTGRLDMDALLDDGELKWLDYTETTVTDPETGKDLYIYEDLDPLRGPMSYVTGIPGTASDYRALQLSIDKKLSNGWMGNASVTFSQSQGVVNPYDYKSFYGYSDLYKNPNAHIHAEGRFPYTYPFYVEANGMYEGPYGINIGGRVVIGGGGSYTRSLSQSYPPLDGINVGQTNIYAEKRGDSRLPTFWMLNLGLEKSFKITDTTTATLAIDWYNATNNTTTLMVNPVSNNPGLAEGEIERILNPGLFQFGVRVSF